MNNPAEILRRHANIRFFNVDGIPDYEGPNVGFRIASVPEPSAGVLMLFGGAVYWLMRRRKAQTP